MRKILFWLHLAAGCIAGIVIFLMSLTGVALTYERQITAWADRGAFRSTGEPIPPHELLLRVASQRPELPTGSALVLRSDLQEPAEITLTRAQSIYVDRATGQILGQSGSGVRRFFQKVKTWHRWIGTEGSNRSTARAVTGACNLAFLLLIVSGPILWMPKKWGGSRARPVAWFRRGLSGKARDFNWHSTIGIWMAIPLFVVVVSAVPMSYKWGNDLLYRIAGSVPPPARGEESRAPAAGSILLSQPTLQGIDGMWSVAAARLPEWRTISMPIPERDGKPVAFAIDTGSGGQPRKRGTLTLTRDQFSGAVLMQKWELADGGDAGRAWRLWARFAHTGEYYGILGQTIAGAAALGAVFLAWTGVSLAIRRWLAFAGRSSLARNGTRDSVSELNQLDRDAVPTERPEQTAGNR